MTRQQLTDPFGSDDEDESPTKSVGEVTQHAISREESTEKIRRDSQVPSLLVIAGSAAEEPEVAKTASDFKADHLRERTIRVNSWSRANETHRLLILLQRRNPFQNKAHRLDY